MSDPSDMPMDLRGLAAIVLAVHADAGLPPEGARADASAALEAGLWPVVVVCDAGDALRGALAGLPVVTVCRGAEAGAAAALQRGLARLLECAPQAAGVFVLTGERATRAGHLRALAEVVRQRPATMAASAADGALCEPVLFTAEVFAELRSLGPEERPEWLLSRHPDRVAVLPLPPAPRPAPRTRLRGVR